MGLFSSIMSKIFSSHPAAAASASPAASGAPAPAASSASAQTPGMGTGAAMGAGAATMPQVDVVAVLSDMAKKHTENLNWKTSIVDLLKLLGLDSSLTARKELAKELHYSGDTSDSASMNMWLQKQVMNKLAENGGKVPAELRS